MKNQFILWFSALVITFLIGYIKTITNANYPVTSTFGIEGKKVSYKLDKIFYGNTSYKNIIISDIKNLKGKVAWVESGKLNQKRFTETDRGLECEIPALDPGEQIKYKILLFYNEKTYEIPKDDFITLTFWGKIPTAVNILYFIFLHGGLLLSIRCGLELFNNNKNLKKIAFITTTFFLILTIALSPLRNSYRIGAINNFVPPIFELFEPLLIIITLSWITGTIFLFIKKYYLSVTIFLLIATALLFSFLPTI